MVFRQSKFMKHNHIPKAEQLRPAERFAQIGARALDAALRYGMLTTGIYPVPTTERQDIALAIEKLQSVANDPREHQSNEGPSE